MKNVLKTNQVLEIIDLRRNPFISNHLVNEVTALLSERQDEYAEQQYTWLDLNCPPPSKLDDKNVEVKTGTYAATGRNRQGTKSKTESQVIVKKPSIPRQHGIPWRVEHRLYERREGMAPGALVETVPSVPEGDFPEEEAPHHQPSEESSVTSHKMIKKLEHYKKCYRKERQLRKHAEKKLARLKAKIKKSHILDEATVTHIETCFQKFQKFLTHLQSLGLHMQLLMPEFEMGNAEGKVLQSSLHPKADAVESFQDSEYRHVSCIPPELLEPSGSQHPVAVFHNPTETDVGVNQQENNTAIPVRQEHLTDKSSEASILPENNLMLLKTSNEVQNTAFSELSEAIDKGTNMLSLLPRGEALEEVDHNPESETSEKDENDDSCSEDEEEISSFHRKSIDHIEQPVLNDYYKDINIKFEGSGMIEANSSEQSCIIIKANHNDSSDSQGLSIKIQGVEDLHVIPNELVTGGVEASSVSSADISNQNIVMELPSLEKQDSMDIPNTEDRSERMRNIKETPDRAGKIIGIKETLNNESMTGKYERVKESSEYSYQKDNVAERHQEIIQDGFIREIPTEDCTNYVEYDDRKSLYQMEDHADIGQSNEVSETDDEKLRMRQSNFNWSGRSGSVSSSVSIAEHLSHSHSRWSKGKSGKKLGRDKQVGDTGKIQTLGKREIKRYHHNTDNIQVTIPVSGKLQPEAGEVEYDSDFEVSDVEGVSISASSLTSTSIPDDLVTPGEEDF